MEDARLTAPSGYDARADGAPAGPSRRSDGRPVPGGAGIGADGGLTRHLLEQPTAYGFYQAVRLLERERGERERVGGFGDPGREVVRFAVNPSLGFPSAEIQTAEQRGDAARFVVNFFGLDGPMGVLPNEYTTIVIDRLRSRDTALAEFLDLFNHRAISLLYRAWARSRFTVAYETDRADGLTQHLLDLVGLGTPEVRGRLPVPDEGLLPYAGLLAPAARSAVALEQLVGDYFDVPARVEQFVGAWYPVETEVQCRLGDEDASTALGLGALVGDEVWDQQARARIRLGPMSRARYDAFLPGGDSYEALRGLVRFFARDEVDFELQLVLAADEVPTSRLGEATLPLGWSTWLRSRPETPFGRDADETVFTL